MYFRILSAIAVVFITFGHIAGQNQLKPVNDFLKDLKGTIHPSVCWYTGSHLDSTRTFIEGSVNTKESQWKCDLKSALIFEGQGKALDLSLTFKL